MAKLELIDSYRIPGYALPYLINGDASGLEDHEINEIEKWLRETFTRHNCLSYDYDTQSSFSNSPAFGLPCDCYDVKVYGHPRKALSWPEYQTAWFDLAAREWFRRQVRDTGAQFYLYYKPHGGGVVIDIEPPNDGWELASPQRVSPAWTVDRVKAFMADTLHSLPCL